MAHLLSFSWSCPQKFPGRRCTQNLPSTSMMICGCNLRTGSLEDTSTASKAGPQHAAQSKHSMESSQRVHAGQFSSTRCIPLCTHRRTFGPGPALCDQKHSPQVLQLGESGGRSKITSFSCLLFIYPTPHTRQGDT